ncbi:uncharacterized protein LOC131234549 [Magnolia sinica]|uniref:uncharacterized protein LOC131234549 n=1 Tax=Magnolia sinica TaxID=86752 RepID=UPI00265B00D3|nr:uncharacterized protein LOC131234549 [Magnolia sinica]
MFMAFFYIGGPPIQRIKTFGCFVQSAVLPTSYPYLLFKGISTYGWPTCYWFLHGVIDKLKYMVGLKASQAMVFNLMGHDTSDGRITLDKSTDRICFTPPHDPLLPCKIQALQKLTKRIGGILFMSRYRSTSVHLLGGCNVASDPSHGVCNPSGQVFDLDGPSDTVHAGLYVCDASLIPCSVGINPCLTIATAAEHVSKHLVQDVLKYKSLNHSPIQFSVAEPIIPIDLHDLKFSDKVVDSMLVAGTDGKSDVRLRSSDEVSMLRREDSAVMFRETMRGYVGGMPCTAYLEMKMNSGGSSGCDEGNTAAGGPHSLLRGKVGGYVVFPAIDKDKLYIVDGKVDLCSIDRRTPYTQCMLYRLLLATASGSRYILEGRKILNPYLLASYAWRESTTLLVNFKMVQQTDSPDKRRCGGSRAEPMNLTGELHLSMVDLLMCLISMRGSQRWKFLYLFLQSLCRTYITQRPRSIHEEFKHLEMNQRAYPPCILHEITTDDGFVISCKQWKCNQNAWRSDGEKPLHPVLLINGHSTESYWLPTESRDLVRTLVEEGYETWLLQPRLHRLHLSKDFTIEDIGKFDIPAAIAKMRELHGPSVKVHVIAHCVGGLSIHIALMGGHVSATQIASLSCTNSSMFFKLTTSSLVKMRLPLIPISMAILGKNRVLLMFANSKDSLRHRLLKAIAKLIPRYERCTCDECEVFSGIFGNAFWHENVSPTMHQFLKESLPMLPMSAFPHLRKICLAGHIIDSNGCDAYLMHSERMAVPTLYVSGGRNLLVTPQTSFLANQYMRLHQPGFTHRRVVVDGFGHSDLWIGEESYKRVFPHILSHMKLVEQGSNGGKNMEESKFNKDSLSWADSNDGNGGLWVNLDWPREVHVILDVPKSVSYIPIRQDQHVLGRWLQWRLAEIVDSAPVVIRNEAKYEGRKMRVASSIAWIKWWVDLILQKDAVINWNSSKGRRFLGISLPKDRPMRCHIIRWNKPVAGWVKLNVDGSSRENPGLSGGESVCHGDTGHMIFAFSSGYGVCSNNIAEVRAIHDGIYFCLLRGLKNIVVESDSEFALSLILGKSRIPWTMSPWVVRILALLKECSVAFSHTFREGNGPTNALARMGSEHQVDSVHEHPHSLPWHLRGMLVLDRSRLGTLRSAPF